MAMTILVAGCLYHPDQTGKKSSLDMYLPSSETERYGMTNGSCPLVFCLQISCRGFEHSYTFVLGSINDSNTHRKWLLKTFAVWFFGMSAEVERCPFVNTFRARHTDAILLSRSMSFWKYSFWLFSQDYYYYCFNIFSFRSKCRKKNKTQASSS